MWGITQHVIEGCWISEGWMMFHGFEAMQQIYRHYAPRETGTKEEF